MEYKEGYYIFIAEKGKRKKEVEADEGHLWKMLEETGFSRGGFVICGLGSSVNINRNDSFQGELMKNFNDKPPYIRVEEGSKELEIFAKVYTPVPLTIN